MKYLVLTIFFQIQTILCAQPDNTSIEFCDYDIIMKDLIAKGIKSYYFNNLDYKSMLYIEGSSLSSLKTINPKFIKEWDIDTTKIFIKPLEQYIFYFNLKSNNIKDFFLDREVFISTISNIVKMENVQLDNKVYIKNNRIAVFLVSKQSWSGKYRAKIIKDKLQVEMLYEQIFE